MSIIVATWLLNQQRQTQQKNLQEDDADCRVMQTPEAFIGHGVGGAQLVRCQVCTRVCPITRSAVRSMPAACVVFSLWLLRAIKAKNEHEDFMF